MSPTRTMVPALFRAYERCSRGYTINLSARPKLVANIAHVVADIFHLPINTPHSIIDAVHALRRSHACPFLYQERCQSRLVSLRDIDSLNLPHFTSFVARARMVSTSTIISTITSVVAVVCVMIVYISSRRKNRPMWLKMSMSLFWPEPLAAGESRVSK